jgi:HlyD family secretion protein
MDVPRKNARRNKIIRWVVGTTVSVAVLSAAGIWVRRIKPAAPPVDGSTLWPDTVRRGDMTREVHGLGTLVPIDTMLITATTDARIERILIRPGTPVKADSLVMVMTSPELETSLLSKQFTLRAGQADYENLKATLEKNVMDMKSKVAQVAGDYQTAQAEADRDAQLLKDGLGSAIDAKISATKAQTLKAQLDIENQRLEVNKKADEAQLAASRVKVDQLQAEYNLTKSQVDQLKVRAGFDGMLEALPAPLTPVEEGQKVTAGTPLGKVAQPSHLKAELKIAETQVKDIAIGQSAVIDTRLAGGGWNGYIDGQVSRIDPSILNGTVTVDVALKGPLPPVLRPDLSVDGTIQLEKLTNVVYMGRPIIGQENATVQLFKYEPDGKYADKVKVTFGKASVTTIEVKSGLSVGDRVILSDMSSVDQYDRIKIN